MTPVSDALTSQNSGAREAVTSAFEAMENWRDEVVAVNERHLTKALDLVASSQRALGWPDHVTTATREHLLKTSKIQMRMIGEVMDAWEQQLKSSASPPSSPRGVQIPDARAVRIGTQGFGGGRDAAPGSDPGHPFMLWMQAAEMWQRNWAQAMTGS